MCHEVLVHQRRVLGTEHGPDLTEGMSTERRILIASARLAWVRV